MSIFGNIQNGVFSGFGKPYIKLEFDDNTALLDFQKRMNESGEAAEAEFENGEFKPMNGTAGDLGAAGDLYLVRDLRTRARKEPGETVSNKNLRFYKIEGEKVSNFNKDIYEKDTYLAQKIDGYRNIYINKKDGNYYTYFTFFEPTKKENWNEPTLAGYWRRIDTLVNINKVLNYHATPRSDDNLQFLEDKGRADGVIHRNIDNITTFHGWITDAYNKELRQNAFKQFYNERLKVDDKYYSKYQKKLLTDFYTNPTSYKIRLIDSYSGGKTSSAIGDSKRDEFVGLLKDSGLSSLGAPGDVYLVIDTRKKTRKELDETAAFKKIYIEKFNINALKALQDSDPLLYEEIKAGINKNNNSDLGKTANPYLYNNNEIIDCRGLKPTYKILDNYDNYFDVADSKTNFAGFGLTDTKKLISETCREHWKDCKKIAAHLKGDSLLQSCFNLWHWLRFNIRYEYDKEGREEIRTPLRVWHDRARGVDCDCLSVFSWCVLRCMGYDPVFELVAFKNRPQFSHIFINCDGVVVDRVWFVFNSRPPLITKRELFRVDLINNLGQLF